MNKLQTAIASAIASTILALGVSSAAQAQFSLPSVPGIKGLGGSTSGGDIVGQQDGLVRGYVAANKDVLDANSLMANALGLKTEAATSAATSAALTEGATKDAIEESNKVVATSTNAVAAEMAKKPVLDAKSKALYGKGLILLASGVTKFAGVGKNVSTMGSSLKSVSPLQLPKLQSAVYIVSNFPDSMTNVSGALKNAVSFAQSQDIPVPTDANDALKAL
ncbi:MAG: hypothetical protein JWQ41_287 [Variovorax sp.]|nr:hypothetical protein [Variovorax sp.]